MSRHDPNDLTRNFRTKITVCDCDGCTAAEEPCWLYSRIDRYGYGSHKQNGRNHVAHRYAYERLVAPIPDDHDIDHLCDRHRNCVNPSHMEPTTKSENARRANNRRWHGTQSAHDAQNQPEDPTEGDMP